MSVHVLLLFLFFKKKISVLVFHPRLTAGNPGHLAPIVVGRLAYHIRTEFIPEASSRPFILIYETHKDSPVRTINIYADPLRSFTLYRLTMCDRAPLSIYVGFPPIVCTL